MPKIAIVTDNGADLSQALRDKHGIHTVPLVVRFGREQYLDSDLTQDEFWEKAYQAPPCRVMAARGSWLQQLCGRLVDSCQFPVAMGSLAPFTAARSRSIPPCDQKEFPKRSGTGRMASARSRERYTAG
jgi:hypothetical protein